MALEAQPMKPSGALLANRCPFIPPRAMARRPDNRARAAARMRGSGVQSGWLSVE